MKGTVSSLFRPSWVKVVVGVLVVGVVVGVPVAVLGQRSPTPPAGLPTVIPGKPPPAVDRAILERALSLERTAGPPEVDLGGGNIARVEKGPRTRGMTIQVGGKSLTLPGDAELDGVMVTVEYSAGKQFPPGVRPIKPPAYIIIRGKSTAVVSIETGDYQVQGCFPEFQFLAERLGLERLAGTDEKCP